MSVEGDGIYINLRGPFKLLPQGEPPFRAALARVSQLHLKALPHQNVHLLVDIDSEVAARRAELAAQARKLAEQALAEKRRIELDPLSPEERRLVHLTLTGFLGVRTYSVGKGNSRRVVIEPTTD